MVDDLRYADGIDLMAGQKQSSKTWPHEKREVWSSSRKDIGALYIKVVVNDLRKYWSTDLFIKIKAQTIKFRIPYSWNKVILYRSTVFINYMCGLLYFSLCNVVADGMLHVVWAMSLLWWWLYHFVWRSALWVALLHSTASQSIWWYLLCAGVMRCTS